MSVQEKTRDEAETRRVVGLLTRLFPFAWGHAWEHVDGGLWRTQAGEFFVRDEWLYVFLDGDDYAAAPVAAEFVEDRGHRDVYRQLGEAIRDRRLDESIGNGETDGER